MAHDDTQKHTTELARYLKDWMFRKDLSLRSAEVETGVSKTALAHILEKPDVMPGLATLQKLADAFGLPLWRVIEMMGYDLGLKPTLKNDWERITSLTTAVPWLAPIAKTLLTLDPNDLEGVLAYLEFLASRKAQAAQPSSAQAQAQARAEQERLLEREMAQIAEH